MLRFHVDFNARDEDDAVRLSWENERAAIDGTVVTMSDGLEVYITDDEVAAIGHIIMRDGIWVVVVSQWLRGTK